MKQLTGWISPNGDYFYATTHDGHLKWLSRHLGSSEVMSYKQEMRLYKEGWIHVGSAGGHNITIHESQLKTKSKSLQKLRELLRNSNWFGNVAVDVIRGASECNYRTLSIDDVLKRFRAGCNVDYLLSSGM